jgi:acetyl-CoA acetyltransferase
MGQRIPGFQMEQACATGLSAVVVAGAEVNSKSYDVAGVLTFDRTSDSPVGVFPERRAYRRTEVISDVWDNFGFDPSTGSAMITTAGLTARKYKIDRAEVDELTALRYKQYFDAKKAGFHNKYLFSFDVLNAQGKLLGTIGEDVGVREISLKTLKEQRELDTCITSGTQTHAADGMAALLVASPQKAKEISTKPEVNIEFIAKVDIRTGPGLMPEAPGMAVQKLLDRTGLTMNDMKVVKNHNPFAVNDAIFGKTLNYDWAKMNNTGCSLVWGHPQAPTLTRTIIEALEEAVDLGGGYVLVFGCAAGDVGTAGIFRVS